MSMRRIERFRFSSFMILLAGRATGLLGGRATVLVAGRANVLMDGRATVVVGGRRAGWLEKSARSGNWFLTIPSCTICNKNIIVRLGKTVKTCMN